MAKEFGIVDVDGLQERTSSTQFLEWVAYLDLEMNSPSRNDYYLMQAAAEARRGWVSSPNKVQLADMVLKFKANGGEDEDSPAKRKARALANKAITLGFLQHRWDEVQREKAEREVREANRRKKSEEYRAQFKRGR